MRVLFIKPSSVSYLRPSVGPPLGIMYLASSLREKGFEVKILDLRLEKKGRDKEEVLRIVEEFDPEVFGISALTTEAIQMHELASFIKKKKPSSLVICGGPHPTSYIKETMEDKNIDFLGIYECEETLTEFLEALRDGGSLSVDGIVLRRNGKLEFKTRPPKEDLDSIPPPAWDLVPIESYSKFRSQSFFTIGRKYMTLFTSRGCPFKCIFCHNLFGKRFRAHSPERVISEIETLLGYGIKDFEIADDIFNQDIRRVHKICELLISKKLKVNLYFSGGLRLDILPDETIYKLKEAGAKYIPFGIESASKRIQSLIKKNLNLERVERAIKLMDKLKIFTCGTFMLGFPGETEEEILETVRFALKNPLTSAMFFIPNPIQGTGLYEVVKEKGTNMDFKFEDFGHLIASINISDIPSGKLFKIQRMAYLKFYLNPKRVVKIILRCPGRRIYILRDFFLFLFFILKRWFQTLVSTKN